MTAHTTAQQRFNAFIFELSIEQDRVVTVVECLKFAGQAHPTTAFKGRVFERASSPWLEISWSDGTSAEICLEDL